MEENNIEEKTIRIQLIDGNQEEYLGYRNRCHVSQFLHHRKQVEQIYETLGEFIPEGKIAKLTTDSDSNFGILIPHDYKDFVSFLKTWGGIKEKKAIKNEVKEEPEEFQIWFGKIGICLPKDQESIDIARTLLDTLEGNLNGTTPVQGQKECSCTRCVTDRHEHSVPEGQQTQAYPVISPAGKDGLLSLVERGVWRIQEVPKFEIEAIPYIVEKLEVSPSSDGQCLKLKRISSAANVKVQIQDMRKLSGLNGALREAAIGKLNKGKKDALRYALRLWDKIEVALSQASPYGAGTGQEPLKINPSPTEDIKNSPEQEEIQDNTSKTLEDSPDKKTTMQNNNHGLELKRFQEDQGFDYSAVQPRWVGKLRVYYGNSNGQLVIKHSERSVTSEILRTTEKEIDRLRQYGEDDLNAVIRGIGRDKQHLLRIYLHELDGILRD